MSAKSASALSASDRLEIVKAALLLMEQVYVHLPLKRAMHAINPVQKLKLLEEQCGKMTDPAFHSEMLSIFVRLRDLHTNYILPAPLNASTAYLPFRVQEFFENGRPGYVVTQVFPRLIENPAFEPGVIVTHWNGVPMERAVDINADREAGSNAAARHARGLESLTMRWLGMSLPPDEDWVDITWHPAGQPESLEVMRFEWSIYESGPEDLGVAAAKAKKARALGLDKRCEVERRVRAKLFPRGVSPLTISNKPAPTLKTSMEDVFPRCGNVKTDHGRFGYIRIATFDVPDDGAFVKEFIRLTRQLDTRGLIIDVRGNGGGLVLAGERLLQCLTPRHIEPERFHFINSKTTLQLAGLQEFNQWYDSISQATQTGTEFSSGFPLLPENDYNNIGQTWQGPVVLITDALCYSTTDIFAAGFQDHKIGPVIGVGANTGAGGANVWDYGLLAELMPGAFPALPGGAEFRVAVRRTTRVGLLAGTPLEDLGVRPNHLYSMTRRDVMEGNPDLISYAAGILKKQPRHSLKAQVTPAKKGPGATIRLAVSNADRVDVYLNGRPTTSVDLRLPQDTCTLRLKAPGKATRVSKAALKGFLKGKLVVSTRVTPAREASSPRKKR
jgi:hypothetical protein